MMIMQFFLVKVLFVVFVGERCDDKFICVIQVFVGVRYGGGDYFDLDQILDEVVAQLVDLREVVYIAGLNFVQVGYYIFRCK